MLHQLEFKGYIILTKNDVTAFYESECKYTGIKGIRKTELFNLLKWQDLSFSVFISDTSVP